MEADKAMSVESEQRGMPDFDYKIGLLRLNRVLDKPLLEPVDFICKNFHKIIKISF